MLSRLARYKRRALSAATIYLLVCLPFVPALASEPDGLPPAVNSTGQFQFGPLMFLEYSALASEKTELSPEVYARSVAVSPPGFTDEEIARLKGVAKAPRSTAAEVAIVNIAVKATDLLIVALAWLAFLIVLRRVFDRWFDEDVYSQPYPSAIVIAGLLVSTAWILVSVVQ